MSVYFLQRNGRKTKLNDELDKQQLERQSSWCYRKQIKLTRLYSALFQARGTFWHVKPSVGGSLISAYTVPNRRTRTVTWQRKVALMPQVPQKLWTVYPNDSSEWHFTYFIFPAYWLWYSASNYTDHKAVSGLAHFHLVYNDQNTQKDSKKCFFVDVVVVN